MIIPVMAKPTIIAINGEVIRGIIILFIIPPTSIISNPPAAMPAPINPPMRTCVSDIGNE